MNEHATTQDRADRFVEKLNQFLETLDGEEQGWLASLLMAAAPEAEVQGYLLQPPFSVALQPPAADPGTVDATAAKAGPALFRFCATGVHIKQATIL